MIVLSDEEEKKEEEKEESQREKEGISESDSSKNQVNDRYQVKIDDGVVDHSAFLDLTEEWGQVQPSPAHQVFEEIKEEELETISLIPKKRKLQDFDLSVEQCINH